MNACKPTILTSCVVAFAHCASVEEPLAQHQKADFVNGNFESGDLTGWALSSQLNPGIGVLPPNSYADLGLQTGGASKTFVRGGAKPESVLAAGLTAGDTLFYPRFGSYTTVVNELGNGRNANVLTQSLTTTTADVDPLDGQVHLRFCLAPVLENPAHSPKEQPYFYLEVLNVTQNKKLFSSFNFGGQPGVPWKNSAGGAVQYTDWQLFDLTPPTGDLQVGDTVKMQIVAAGCSLGGHYGHLYVDGFGSMIPGLTVVASAPKNAPADSDLTYTFQVRNGGASSASGVIVNDTLPQGTTFVSVAGATCTTPALGATGAIACQLGSLAAGAGTTFQLTVHIDRTAAGTVNNGDYNVRGLGISPLIGPLVQTDIAYDIQVLVPGGGGAISCTTPVLYGKDAVCSISPGAGSQLLSLSLDGRDVLAGVKNGSFTIANVTTPRVLLGTFSAAKFDITTSVPGGNGSLICQSPVLAGASSVCSLIPDPGFAIAALGIDGKDASAGVVNGSYTLQKVSAPHQVQATFAPATYAITTAVPGGNGSLQCQSPVAHGQDTSCKITPAAGYVLATLSVDGSDVSGQVANDVYTLSGVTAARRVQATFVQAKYKILVSTPGGNGSIDCSSPVGWGQTAVCQILPKTGYELGSLTLDGNGVLGQVQGSSLLIPKVTSDRMLSGVFTPVRYTVTGVVLGGNGSLACTAPVAYGGSASCQITPDLGYVLNTLSLDGSDALWRLSGDSVVLPNVISSHLLQASFSLATFSIQTSVPGGHGTLRCIAPVTYGQSVVCQVEADPGYRLKSLALNTGDISGWLRGTSVILPPATSANTLQAIFESIPGYSIQVSVPAGHGEVACNDPVPEGQDATCTIRPEAGYELTALSLDGVDARILNQAGTLKLYRVTQAHSLVAEFKKARAGQCASSADCGSGFCVDGLCCDRACGGQCEACDVAGMEGTCTPVVAGPPHASHPSCGTYVCAPQGCLTSCRTDSDCIAGSICAAGSCREGQSAISGGGCSVGPDHAAGTERPISSIASALSALVLALGLRPRRRRLPTT